MRTRTFLLLLICFFIKSAIAQKAINAQPDTTNLYSIALKLSLERLKDIPMPQDDYDWRKKIINVELDTYSSKKLPTSQKEYKINYLSKGDLLKKTKNGNTLYTFVIEPLTVENNLLIIRIIKYQVKALNKKLLYGNIGGTVSKFKYNCQKENFEISQVSLVDQ